MCVVVERGPRSAEGCDDFPVIDSYLETGLMELSTLYANSLFP